jgi:hypothetical protein
MGKNFSGRPEGWEIGVRDRFPKTGPLPPGKVRTRGLRGLLREFREKKRIFLRRGIAKCAMCAMLHQEHGTKQGVPRKFSRGAAVPSHHHKQELKNG